MDIRKTPGRQLINDSTGEIIYTPPEGENTLRNMLANWEQFIHNEEEIDPLVRMAVGHYQFEAVHPFIDGNGRTGRVINILYLIQQDLLPLPILSLSRHIILNKNDYYTLLLDELVIKRGSLRYFLCLRRLKKHLDGQQKRLWR